MSKGAQIVAYGLGALMALMGVCLPLKEASLVEEPEPVEEEVEKDTMSGGDGPRLTGWSRYWPRPGYGHARLVIANRTVTVTNMLAWAASAQLPPQIVEKLSEISHELAENLFERHEKEEALDAAFDAMLASLHASRSKLAGKPRAGE